MQVPNDIPNPSAADAQKFDDLGTAYSLNHVGLPEYLDADPRPTFVVDLADDRPRPSYINTILRQNHFLLAAISGASLASLQDADHELLSSWVRSGLETGLTHSFASVTWTKITLRNRWRIVQGELPKPATMLGAATTPQENGPGVVETERREQIAATRSAVQAAEPIARVVDAESAEWVDVTGDSIDPAAAENLQLIHSFDWSNTSLGPREKWSRTLRLAVQMVICNPKPANLIWGRERHILYNDQYCQILGQKHPEALGARFFDVYPEVTGFDQLFGLVEETHRGVTCKDCLYFLHRHGFIEETYFSFSMIPLFDNGVFVGVYNPVWETTQEVLGHRRTATLISIAELTAAPKDLQKFWRNAVEGFKLNENDFPLASVYAGLAHQDTANASSTPSITHFKLAGSTNTIPPNHPLSQPLIDIEKDDNPLAALVKKVLEEGEAVLLRASDNTLPSSLVTDVYCPPFGDPCNALIVCPIKPTNNPHNVRGFVVIGLNPRLPHDQSYSRFIDLVMRHIGTSLASAMLIDEEMRRAALEQAELEAELAKTNKIAESAKMQFQHFADSAPIGINIMDQEGNVLYANEVWYQTTQVQKNCGAMAWMSAFVFDEVESVSGVWERLTVAKESVSFETRLRRPWCPPGNMKGECLEFTWILACAYPDLNHDGTVKRIVGCFVDISQQKYIEQVQTRRMNDAIEAKRLQESFIDMTSHEMRNPLSAVVHAADGIISLLSKDLESPVSLSELTDDAIASSLDAAKSIVHCSLHQKRIADDILTASKLDSNLLPVCPDKVQLVEVVKVNIRMFEGESKAASIKLNLELDRSLDDLNVDWVCVDPSRLTQVFVNLLANAIKFTQTEDRKNIKIRVGASIEPHHPNFSVRYVELADAKRPYNDPVSSSEWGNGQVIYLHFAVEDTGRGLTESERDMLFRRFSQATPRTHVTYGGSGLGLFISRELTELQGGEIGVASTPGHGSTFSFYIKARKTNPPHGEELSRVSSHSSALSSRPRGLSNLGAPSTGTSPRTPSFPQQIPIHDRPSAARRISAEKHNPHASAATKAQRDDGFAVLYVEDNLVNRKVLSKQLRHQGFIVYEANHGVEALEFLRTTEYWNTDIAASNEIQSLINTHNEQNGFTAQPPPTKPPPPKHNNTSGPIKLNVVLMDLEMPVMDGLTCMRAIRALEVRKVLSAHVPTIAVTANARREQVQAALDAGMDGVVSKPFRMPELIMRMEELVDDFTAAAASAATNGSSMAGPGNGSPSTLLQVPV